jgi:hypothetical protein
LPTSRTSSSPIRSNCTFGPGEEAREAANKLCDPRDKLDGPEDVDQGIEVSGKANIVPSTPDGIAFKRTPQQVLRIVYLNDKPGVSGGGLFPQGMNSKQQRGETSLG